MQNLFVVLFLCLTLASCATTGSLENRLLEEHNKERESVGVHALALDAAMCSYARKHADRMAKSGRLVHSSMSDLATEAGNGNVGENIAYGQASEEKVTDSWMGSQGHRANILSKRYKRVGFGVSEDAKGNKYWCAVFAG